MFEDIKRLRKLKGDLRRLKEMIMYKNSERSSQFTD